MLREELSKTSKIGDLINKVYKTALVQPKDQYSLRDLEDSANIVEVKHRKKYYKDKLIEAKKYLALVDKFRDTGQRPRYVVNDPNGVYVWDLRDFLKDMKWYRLPNPKQTYRDDKKILKYVGVLPEEMGYKIYDRATKIYLNHKNLF